MIKYAVIAFFTIFLMACSQTQEPLLKIDGSCEEPRPEICTMEYDPVCGEVNGELKEYGNACSACGDPEINTYQKGACPK
ncbi:Kazal-type serine protease inhibitor [Agarivorans litoreus]|uniref:Kazal-type serine protease inhibitor n=1 Tax=Agarivorans litoreus TaxID=1510455 RepID=UPI001C7D8099|nr:Kazal-type serine protease inhibitor [Agarivorans litoreus]